MFTLSVYCARRQLSLVFGLHMRIERAVNHIYLLSANNYFPTSQCQCGGYCLVCFLLRRRYLSLSLTSDPPPLSSWCMWIYSSTLLLFQNMVFQSPSGILVAVVLTSTYTCGLQWAWLNLCPPSWSTAYGVTMVLLVIFHTFVSYSLYPKLAGVVKRSLTKLSSPQLCAYGVGGAIFYSI